MIRVAPDPTAKEGNIYFLARPNRTMFIELWRNLVNVPVWSADGMRASFNDYTIDNSENSYLLLWEMASFLPPQPVTRYGALPQWSADGQLLGFIYYANERRLGTYALSGAITFHTAKSEQVVSFAFMR